MEYPHSKVLAQAAKRHLAPLGLTRKGRSRTWLDDQKWFVIIVEFQSSGFSKGTYLNVGAHFLWYPSGHVSFDLGSRIDGWVLYESDEQFSPEADRLATSAAVGVERLRRLLSGIGAVARELPEGDWPSYHRAIALGLSGDVGAASRTFAALIEPPHDQAWVAERASRCAELQARLSTPVAFRDAVTELIRQQRHALRLPIVSQPLPVF